MKVGGVDYEKFFPEISTTLVVDELDREYCREPSSISNLDCNKGFLGGIVSSSEAKGFFISQSVTSSDRIVIPADSVEKR